MEVLAADADEEIQTLKKRTQYKPEGLKTGEKVQETSISTIRACVHAYPPQLYHSLPQTHSK